MHDILRLYQQAETTLAEYQRELGAVLAKLLHGSLAAQLQ